MADTRLSIPHVLMKDIQARLNKSIKATRVALDAITAFTRVVEDHSKNKDHLVFPSELTDNTQSGQQNKLVMQTEEEDCHGDHDQPDHKPHN